MSTRVTNKSYGSRIGNSFKGIIGGVFSIFIAIGLLWWNEKYRCHGCKKWHPHSANDVPSNSCNHL